MCFSSIYAKLRLRFYNEIITSRAFPTFKRLFGLNLTAVTVVSVAAATGVAVVAAVTQVVAWEMMEVPPRFTLKTT